MSQATLPDTLTDALQQLSSAPAHRWLELARRLRDARRHALAFTLIDAAHTHAGVPRQRARRLALDLGAAPFDAAGHPFLPYTGPRPAERLPTPADDASLLLIPGETGWHRVRAGARSPEQSLDLDPEDAPASALPSEREPTRVVTARGRSLVTWGADGESTTRIELPDHVDALLGLDDGRCVATVRTEFVTSDDLYIAALDEAPPRAVAIPNLFVELERRAVRWGGAGFACCRSGVQSSEVRFVAATLPATWMTRFAHPCTVIAVAPYADGAFASLDRDGLLHVWRGAQPRIDHSAHLPVSLQIDHRGLTLALDPHRPRAFVHDPPSDTLIAARLDDDAWRRLPGLGPRVVVGVRDEPLLTQSPEGWLWLDPDTLTLPEDHRLSVALASEDELRALPLEDAVVAALRGGTVGELRPAERARARLFARPLPEAPLASRAAPDA